MYSVLYVDDEPALLELAKVFLERTKDFIIIPKISADEGLDALRLTPLDAIISDYQMPGKNGIEFLKEVRARHGDIPFILFTGKGREDVVIDAINNGADFYLQKGGNPTAQFAELAHKIRTAVEHKRAGHSLRESEQRQADIINFLPDATFAINAGGTVIAWNRAMEDMSGIKKEDMLGKGNYEYSIPFYGERRPLLLDLVLSVHKEIEKFYPNIQRKNDSLISEMFVPCIYSGRGAYLWFIASPLYDTRGTVIGAIEGIRDVSDRKKIEMSLAESEQRYRAVVEDQTEFICRFAPDGTHNFVNEAYCRYFGKTREEIIGKKFTPRIPAEDRPGVRKHFATLTRENPTATHIHRIELDNGEIRWHRWSDRAIFDTGGTITEYQSVGRDITSQKQTELELAVKRDYLDRIYSSVKAGIVIIDAKTHDIIDANPMAVEMIGATKEQVLGKVCHRFICPAEWGNCPITDKGLSVDNSERVLLTADGRKKSIVKYVTLAVLDGREVLLETFIDNTPRKQAEEELQAAYFQLSAAERELQQKYEELHKSKLVLTESEKTYRTIFENTGTATMIIDEDRTILLINSKCEEISGYTRAEIEGKRKWTEFIDREDLQKMVSYNKQRWKSPEIVPSQYEFKFIAKNSEVKRILLSIGLIPGTKKAVASLLDITGYKKMEEEIRANEEKFRSLVANSLNGILIVDFTGKLLFANPHAGHIIGGDQYPALFGTYNVLDLLLPEFRAKAVLDFARVLTGTDGYLVNYKIATPFSGEMWIECVGKKITYEGSSAVLLSINNTTERIKAQEALQESEKKFRFLAEKMNDMVWTVDMDLRCTYVSPSITKLLGFTPEERRQQGIGEQVTPASVAVIQETLERELEIEKRGAADPDRSVVVELEFFHKDGSVRWMESVVSGIRDASGTLTGFHGVSRDISERKKTETALRESEEKFRSLVDNANEAIFVIQNGRICFANSKIVRIGGYTVEELAAKPFLEFVHPDDRAMVGQQHQRRLANENLDATYAFRILPKDGPARWMEINASLISWAGQPAVLVFLSDITKRRQAEESLRESEERFRNLMDHIPGISVQGYRADGTVVFWNRASETVYGYSAAEAIGKKLGDLIIPAPLKPFFGECLLLAGNVRTSGEFMPSAELVLQRKDGTPVTVFSIHTAVCIEGKEPLFFCIDVDLSERKKTEQILRENEMEFQSVMQQVPDIVSIISSEGVLLYNSPAALQIHGYDESDLAGKNTLDFIHPDDRNEVAQKIQLLLASPGSSRTVRYRYRNKDSTYVWMEATGRTRTDSSGRTEIVTISRDISERKRVEDALSLANRKLNLLNNVTRHDILNKLMALSGNLELAQNLAATHSDQKKYLKNARDAASVIGELISFTREYQNLGAYSFAWQNINDIVKKATKTLNLGSVKVISDLNDIEIFTDPFMEKIWYNLLDNSLRHGGNVTRIRITASDSGENLLLIYEDDGAGIPANLKEKIFEPAYGKNTGYGLFFIREVLSLSGITIKEDGTPGKRARFVMSVPKGVFRISEAEPPLKERPGALSGIRRKRAGGG